MRPDGGAGGVAPLGDAAAGRSSRNGASRLGGRRGASGRVRGRKLGHIEGEVEQTSENGGKKNKEKGEVVEGRGKREGKRTTGLDATRVELISFPRHLLSRGNSGQGNSILLPLCSTTKFVGVEQSRRSPVLAARALCLGLCRMDSLLYLHILR